LAAAAGAGDTTGTIPPPIWKEWKMKRNSHVSRRRFLQVSSAMVTSGVVTAASGRSLMAGEAEEKPDGGVRRYRTLGRTGFRVSDIGYGCGPVTEGSLIRHAVDKGVNYLDTSEVYLRGQSERSIGNAMAHIDRKKIFLTTKLPISEKDNKTSIIARFSKCQERLKTDYVDALFIHGIPEISTLNHEGFHAAVAELKARGRLRHIGISCHEPGKGERMEDICIAAAEDGRFDLMLFVYNFMNKETGERILAACKKHKVGTAAMKTAPGSFDKPQAAAPDDLPEEKIQYMVRAGASREEAIERLLSWSRSEQAKYDDTRVFVKKHGIESEDRLRKASIQWVLRNSDMQTICVSMSSYDSLDSHIQLSGTELAHADRVFLGEYARTFNDQYCRLGCTGCLSSCPSNVPVSTVMRYSYYFNKGSEKAAMAQYHSLRERKANQCLTCDAPCEEACPYGVKVQARLARADSMLSFA